MRLCRYMQYLQQSLSTTSLCLMVLISFERLFTFMRPHAVKKVSEARIAYGIIVVVICLCFALHVDELVSFDVKTFRWVNFAYGLCSIERHSSLVPKHITIIIEHSHLFLLLFLLNLIIGVYICCHICQRDKRLSKNSTPISPNYKSRGLKIALANEITLPLLCQSMWLLIAYLPIDLYYSLISFKSIDSDRDNSTIVFIMRYNLLIYLAFSPMLYVVLSPTLRKEIHLRICRLYKQHKETSLFYIPSTNNRLAKLLTDHQALFRRQVYPTAVTTKHDELTRKLIPTAPKLPKKCLIELESSPCLLTSTNDNELK